MIDLAGVDRETDLLVLFVADADAVFAAEHDLHEGAVVERFVLGVFDFALLSEYEVFHQTLAAEQTEVGEALAVAPVLEADQYIVI